MDTESVQVPIAPMDGALLPSSVLSSATAARGFL